MQNSTLNRVEENEVSRFSQLLQRIKIAFKLIRSPKAIVIINSKIDAFQTPPKEVGTTLAQISFDVNMHLQHEAIITQSINNIVYN